MKTTIYYRDGTYAVYPAGLRMLFYHIWRAWRWYRLAPWTIVKITSIPGGVVIPERAAVRTHEGECHEN